jgi:hypothetical protein
MENFQWTDEMVNEFAKIYKFADGRYTGKYLLDKFKEDQSKMSSTKEKWVDEEIERVRKEFSSKDESWKDKIVAFECWYKGTAERFIWKRNANGLFINDKLNHTYLYPPDDWNYAKIVSVKNDSGIEFSIGDEVFMDNESMGNIKSFMGYKDMILCSADWCEISIKKLTKEPKKQPLFTTEEGVKIFDMDKYYWIESLSFNIHEETATNYHNYANSLKRFHSKEKAEQYIAENKPSISYQKMKDYCGELIVVNVDGILSHFKPKK